MRRGLALVIATGSALLALAPAAQADHHFVSISEVYPGSNAAPDAEFVEITMYSGGQNNFAPASELVFYDGTSSATVSVDLSDVLDGTSQRTLLAGTSSMESTFGVQADTEYVSTAMAPAGGGVCLTSTSFGEIDCVAWGTATLASAGSSALAPANGLSLKRNYGANCNTLAEEADDTDQSNFNFAQDSPGPQPNSGPPTGNSCPNTQITKKPKAKTKDRTPKFEFSGGDDYDCNLDDVGFVPCDTPYAPGKLSKGKHEIEVQASETDGSLDGTPAKYDWKIVKK